MCRCGEFRSHVEEVVHPARDVVADVVVGLGEADGSDEVHELAEAASRKLPRAGWNAQLRLRS